jgi:hypothetical protein
MTTAPVTSVALIDGINVDAVAAAVTACPGVSGLFGGRGDAIASYLPGRRVPGVEVQPFTVTIHVRGRWGVSASQLLAEIAAAVSPLLLGKRLQVVVADIDDPDPAVGPALPTAPGVAATDVVALDPAVPRPPGSAPPATPPTPTPAFPTV